MDEVCSDGSITMGSIFVREMESEPTLQQVKVQPAATSVSFLPLSHITARHVDLALLQNGASIAYVPFVQDLPRALLEIRPKIFVAVPRVYEKVHAEVE